MGKIVIVGSGPAGVSAALYAARAGHETTVLSGGSGSLRKAGKIENYYGLAGPVSGPELEARGIAGAERLGVRFVNTEVVGLRLEETFTVSTSGGDRTAEAVVLATGNPRIRPGIAGLAEFEGRGVSYCAVCDGFFCRGKPVAVIGGGEYALHETEVLLPLTAEVTVCTNGEEPSAAFPDAVPVIRKRIAAVEGDGGVGAVRFEDGTGLEVRGIFVAFGVAGGADLARKIGAETDGNRIVVDGAMATGIPGLYAAGDCTGGLMQIAKAVYEGAVAGIGAAGYLRKRADG